MADQPISSSPARNSTLEIERIRHVPEWEIPTNYPPRKPENPFLSKIQSFIPRKPATAASSSSTPTIPSAPAAAAAVPHHNNDIDNTESKETFSPSSTSTSAGAAIIPPGNKAPLLDRYFPPGKTYLGRFTRRAFLLILLALLLLIILALGLGLGLGLKHRKAQSIPLPWSSAGKGVQKGELTYYSPSLGAGACGWQSSDNDSIVAISHVLFDAGLDASGGTRNSNENTLCGRTIRVWEEGRDKGEGVEVEVVDRCTGCDVRDLDLSDGVFGEVVRGDGGHDRGRVRGEWEWV
ncbi:RlpA-like double-psi beta-barrel-protein domain-containing protein-containing protein [Apiosordaria backusii]|uniref:RlpA-like double-psi beta-barrel-protein domain-containing protein-containing protein n=1 Tax=Apiosordaria backusii TaxID=314023 RepID=A0AA40DZR8_9PEZI|nr:RlpA-like double-psi beta-barrel-protein domain-containing protein-containing protein [Apiosordaria backusii]